MVHDITKIPVVILSADYGTKRRTIKRCSIAKRMSWAAFRKTSRIEDRAYSLLGIFDINMPMLYGEGNRAFQRLQEEIIKNSTDHSIFSFWRQNSVTTLFAIDPGDFDECSDVDACEPDKPMESYSMTNRGLWITLPVVRDIAPTNESWPDRSTLPQIEVALNCRDRGSVRTLVLTQLTKPEDLSNLPLEYKVPRSFPVSTIPLESYRVAERDKRTIVIVRKSYNA